MKLSNLLEEYTARWLVSQNVRLINSGASCECGSHEQRKYVPFLKISFLPSFEALQMEPEQKLENSLDA